MGNQPMIVGNPAQPQSLNLTNATRLTKPSVTGWVAAPDQSHPDKKIVRGINSFASKRAAEGF